MTEATRGDDPAGVEWGEVEALWAGFERALSEQLARMVDPDEADLLILEVPGFDDDVPGTAPYVQFAVGDAGEALHTEVSGNAYLERPFMLDDASCARMRAAGWSGADADEKNWFRDDPVPQAAAVSRSVVEALRAQFGVAHPELLTYRAWGPAAESAARLGLCASTSVPIDTVDQRGASAEAFPDAAVHEPESRDDLLALVGAVLRHKFETVTIDDDGDFVVVHLGQPVFVSALADQPAVQIFTRVVHGVRSRRGAAVEIGLLNRDHPWVKWSLRDRSVWQSVMVPAMPFADFHLELMLDIFWAAMSETRDDLALRTGGEVA
ncbi:T3SS (YopN, CesT) and YbjN peptide-binding chaperone 1 [Nocardioides daphniae]|uniref:YbjN domain-containing protein n=1 Tax=Nocardioides daphniae TaxID=402297 RepID=A0ABQ1QJ87_9ACTN|nr:hypothetical protein [Nocardioides daphniae]GGD28531.1 hypothetical protein GCM10007231_30060 [Nocardioides daphniae]